MVGLLTLHTLMSARRNYIVWDTVKESKNVDLRNGIHVESQTPSTGLRHPSPVYMLIWEEQHTYRESNSKHWFTTSFLTVNVDLRWTVQVSWAKLQALIYDILRHCKSSIEKELYSCRESNSKYWFTTLFFAVAFALLPTTVETASLQSRPTQVALQWCVPFTIISVVPGSNRSARACGSVYVWKELICHLWYTIPTFPATKPCEVSLDLQWMSLKSFPV